MCAAPEPLTKLAVVQQEHALNKEGANVEQVDDS